MKVQTYVATVKILVQANTKWEARDAISALLSQSEAGMDIAIDWSYLSGDQPDSVIGPVRGREIYMPDPEPDYEEGDFLAWEETESGKVGG